MDLPGLNRAVLLKAQFCPLRCGATVLGKEYNTHLNEKCPLRQALCPDGCGERVLGRDLEEHRREICPMARLLDRAERALEERALVELRIAREGMAQEKSKATARVYARGEDMPTGTNGWAHSACAKRMANIESGWHELSAHCRRRSNEHMTSILSTSGGAGELEKTGAVVSAFQYWDSLEEGGDEEAARGSRPWDIEAPFLQPLMEVVEEANACGADAKLRSKCEVMLMGQLKRLLEAALNGAEEDPAMLPEVAQRVERGVRLIELEDPGDLPLMLDDAWAEVHRSALRSLPSSAPEFHKAVADGDVELVRWFLDREKANPSVANPGNGLTPLVVASKAGHVQLCDILLERRADVDGRCAADGLSALHWACNLRNAAMVDVLLRSRANPRLQDKKGQDPLTKLVRRGDLDRPAPGFECTWEVRSRQRLWGPRLKPKGLKQDDSALREEVVMDIDSAQAACSSDSACVGFCFRSSDPPECLRISFCGLAPPGVAEGAAKAAQERRKARQRRREQRQRKVEEEIENMINSQQLDDDKEAKGENNEQSHVDDASSSGEDGEDEANWTCYLKIATEAAHDIRALLAAGADPCLADKGGQTALHHHLVSAQGGAKQACVAALLQGGADVNQQDNTGRRTTPFLLAILQRRQDLVELMLSGAWPPADVDARTSDNLTALHISEKMGAPKITELLKRHGASKWADAELRFGGTHVQYDTRQVIAT